MFSFKPHGTDRMPPRRGRGLGIESLEQRVVLDGSVGLVSAFGSPWQNPVDPHDVNNDGALAPNDAIEVLNLTNRYGAGKLNAWSAPPTLHRHIRDVPAIFADSSGDGFLSAIDTLEIVRRINGLPASPFFEEPAREDFYPDFADVAIPSLDLDQGYGHVRSALEFASDVDFLRLIPDQERLSITAFADGVTGGLVVQVLDRDLQVIGDSAATIAAAGAREPDWASATAEITLPVETGELHYLRVQAKDPMSVGRYALSVVNFDGGWWLPVADSPAGQDIHAEVPGENATELALATGVVSVSSFLDRPGDVDTFRVAVPAGVLDVSVKPLGNQAPITVQFYAEDGSLLAGAATERADHLKRSVPAGDYFVSVQGLPQTSAVSAEGEATGRTWQYLLDVRHHQPRCHLRLDSELGDDIHVDEIGDAATSLAFDDGGSACLSSFLDRPDDVDVFRFTAQSERFLVGAGSVGAPHRVSVQVVDSEGEPVTPNDPPHPHGFRSGRVHSLAEGETYYLVVGARQDTVGQYVLRARFIETAPETPRPAEVTLPELPRPRPHPAPRPEPACPPPSDSSPGVDEHSDQIGAATTTLEFDDRGRACVRSFLDRGDDRDVFQFTAISMNLSAVVHGHGVMITAHDADGNVIDNLVDRPPRPDGVRLEIDLVEGEEYFLVISSRAGEHSDAGDRPRPFLLTAHQYDLGIDPIVFPAPRPEPACSPASDSPHGVDTHSDEIGDAATPLEFDDRGHACVRSILDRGDDRDVFQFTASSMNLSAVVHGRGLMITAHDADGNALDNLVSRPPGAGGARLEIDLVEGAEVFLVISYNADEHSDEGDRPQPFLLTAHQYDLGVDPIL